ncbi:GDCCVxC domain-containing (seleno)protein [Hymenobacter roseosalivarius]
MANDKALISPSLTSVLTCPVCQHQQAEQMPTDACQYFYECSGCHTVLKPLAGECACIAPTARSPTRPFRSREKAPAGVVKLPLFFFPLFWFYSALLSASCVFSAIHFRWPCLLCS